MRNFKRLMAGALALVLALGMTLTVSAAESPSKEGRIVVDEVDVSGVKNDADKTAIKGAEKGTTTADFVKEITATGTTGAQAVADALSGKKWLTNFFDVHGEGNIDTTNVDVPLEITGISAYSKDEITVVHYNTQTQSWETCDFKLLGGDNISVHFNSLSPTAVAVVVNQKKDEPSDPDSGKVKKSSSSPKTGVSTEWEMFALAAVAFALCGVSFSRKKRV